MRAAIISMLAMPPCLAFQQTPPLQIRRRLTAVAGTGAAFTSCRRLKSSCSGSHSRHPLLLQRPSMSDDAAAAAADIDFDFDGGGGGGGGGGATGTGTGTVAKALSAATNMFPLWVLGAAAVGYTRPAVLSWFRGGLIEPALGLTMVCMGATLRPADFRSVAAAPGAVAVGFGAQFLIMPAMAAAAALLFKLPPVFAAGLVLVGCCPGGTASNLVTLIAGADVALSVAMTSASTLMASFLTPLLASLLLGSGGGCGLLGSCAGAAAGATAPAAAAAAGGITLSGSALVTATLRVVLLPVALGMGLRGAAPGFADDNLAVVAPPLCVALVALICGGIVAQNAPLLHGAAAAAATAATAAASAAGSSSSSLSSAAAAAAGSSASSSFLWPLVGAVTTMHVGGFLFGYLAAAAFGFPSKVRRTVSIETGMQNSALGTVLAMRALSSSGSGAGAATAASAAALPGAISATVHSCLGSALAGLWRAKDASEQSESATAVAGTGTAAAFKEVLRGDMRKRDFFRSRIVRVSRKLNPGSDCASDEECLVELDGADPTDVTMALKEEVGDNWWLKRRLAFKIFGRQGKTNKAGTTAGGEEAS